MERNIELYFWNNFKFFTCRFVFFNLRLGNSCFKVVIDDLFLLLIYFMIDILLLFVNLGTLHMLRNLSFTYIVLIFDLFE